MDAGMLRFIPLNPLNDKSGDFRGDGPALIRVLSWVTRWAETPGNASIIPPAPAATPVPLRPAGCGGHDLSQCH